MDAMVPGQRLGVVSAWYRCVSFYFKGMGASQRMLWLQVMGRNGGRCGNGARGTCGAAILGAFSPLTPPALSRPAGRERVGVRVGVTTQELLHS